MTIPSRPRNPRPTSLDSNVTLLRPGSVRNRPGVPPAALNRRAAPSDEGQSTAPSTQPLFEPAVDPSTSNKGSARRSKFLLIALTLGLIAWLVPASLTPPESTLLGLNRNASPLEPATVGPASTGKSTTGKSTAGKATTSNSRSPQVPSRIELPLTPVPAPLGEDPDALYGALSAAVGDGRLSALTLDAAAQGEVAGSDNAMVYFSWLVSRFPDYPRLPQARSLLAQAHLQRAEAARRAGDWEAAELHLGQALLVYTAGEHPDSR